jgi:hypothetical protein
MMATDPSLNYQQNVEVMQFMEAEVLKMAQSKGFAGIFTTNTNPLTQVCVLQLANTTNIINTMLPYWKQNMSQLILIHISKLFFLKIVLHISSLLWLGLSSGYVQNGFLFKILYLFAISHISSNPSYTLNLSSHITLRRESKSYKLKSHDIAIFFCLQQLGTDVYDYKVLNDYQVNLYVAPDGSKPFQEAPDSQRAICSWRQI